MTESTPETSQYGGMSVNNEDDIVTAGKNPLDFLRDQFFGAARLIVGPVRKENMKVGREPIPGNLYHCNVWGIQTKKQRRLLAEMAVIIKEPADVV